MNIVDPKPLEDPENHDVPFGSLPVVGFAQVALRQAVIDWWRPTMHYKNSHCPSILEQLMCLIPTRGEERVQGKDPSIYKIQAEILIDYPLQKPWMIRETIDRAGLGIIFGLAHDLYKHVYNLDDRRWKDIGYDEAPRITENMSNRSYGAFVWGHDMNDLVFEKVLFTPADDIEPFDPTVLYNSQPPFLGRFGFSVGS